MSDRVAAQTQQTADVGRRLEMHAHEMTSRMTFASAKKGALRSVQRAAAKGPRSWRSSTVMAERRHIETVLTQTGGVIEGPAGEAKILNLHPNTLRSRMKKLGVQRPATHEVS
jgi:transcriptional regulator with GAF, ATPase, and Fis domain